MIKSIAREAGYRTKMAVSTTEERIDPIGSCVGQRGTRIMAVINELGGEKIDVILWQESPDNFIANALSPAKVSGVKILENNSATVFVPEDQFSLAIGKDGRNVRLAANLTGWKIDVKVGEAPAVKEAAAAESSDEPMEEKAESEKEKKEKKPKKVKKSKAKEVLEEEEE